MSPSISVLIAIFGCLFITGAFSCRDKRSDCAKWHGKGKCTSTSVWTSWMKKNCPKICNMCFDVSEDGGYSCRDTRSDCAKYTKQGKCRGSSAWRKWMADKCPKSCGCPYCHDYSDKCTARASLCVSGTVAEIKWMNKNCRKTCGCQPVEGCGVRGTSAKAAAPLTSVIASLLGEDDTRIVGGDDAEPGQYPWQAGIWYTDVSGEQTEKPFCGGTLLTPNVVVTAAHCFPDNTDPASHQVRLGDLKVATVDEGERIMVVKNIIKHPGYVEEIYLNDIALVILTEAVDELTPHLKPACIPETNELPSSCWISGWGATAEEGATAGHLQHVTVPIVDNAVCDNTYKALFEDENQVITENMRCAGYEAGKKDACQGDSGGPLSCDYDGKFHLSGVVSWGQGCARAKSYGVYTNVYNYLDWIRTNIDWQF